MFTGKNYELKGVMDPDMEAVETIFAPMLA
jgi:hypothetical protein